MPRRANNLLALAVLSLLRERPMHPYELAATMRQRELSTVVKLTTGTLYSVIEALQRDEWIAPVATQRHSQYPERTVYATTDVGQAALLDWLRALLRAPSAEYPPFAAALAFLGHLPPPEVMALLEDHTRSLQAQIEGVEGTLARGRDLGIDRLFLVEDIYTLALLRTKLGFVRQLIADIGAGELTEATDGVVTWKIHRPDMARTADADDSDLSPAPHDGGQSEGLAGPAAGPTTVGGDA